MEQDFPPDRKHLKKELVRILALPFIIIMSYVLLLVAAKVTHNILLVMICLILLTSGMLATFTIYINHLIKCIRSAKALLFRDDLRPYPKAIIMVAIANMTVLPGLFFLFWRIVGSMSP